MENPADRGPKRYLRTGAILLMTGLCGWLVMQLEILGGRMLQPYWGSNTYVTWGSVIGVFLLSLAAGYLLGGWISSRPRSKMILGLNLSAAGLWLCLIPLMLEPLCYWLEDRGLGVKSGALLSSLALYALPTLLLGTVSPTAVRWLTSSAGESGLKAGLVFAFSTAASFAGCVVTAFYLVLLRASRTNRISGWVLIAMGTFLACSAAIGKPSGAVEEQADETAHPG